MKTKRSDTPKRTTPGPKERARASRQDLGPSALAGGSVERADAAETELDGNGATTGAQPATAARRRSPRRESSKSGAAKAGPARTRAAGATSASDAGRPVREAPPPASRRSPRQKRDPEVAGDVETRDTPDLTGSARPEDASSGAISDATSGAPTVVAQIRELEAQLDRLIDEASRRDLSSLAGDDEDEDVKDDVEITRDARPGAAERAPGAHEGVGSYDGVLGGTGISESHPIRPPLPSVPERPSSPSLSPSEQTVFDTARELLSTDFYLRKWGRLAMRGRSEEVDDFGFDPIYEQKARSLFEFLYTRYFRVETRGIDNVPARGRCLLVANHSGTLPLDGVMIKTAVKLEHGAPRDVRWLTEDFIYHMPYLGSMMNRLGAVRACQENAERLLSKEQLVAVFPEGIKGIGKLFAERYRLQRFGRGGFIKLCLRTQTPIVPVAVVGAEETNPLLFRIEYLSKALGVPYVPVTPTFPALGPLGLLPAPTKWRIQFGEPLDFSAHGRGGADDELLVGKLAERVRATIQGMLDRSVAARKSVFFG